MGSENDLQDDEAPTAVGELRLSSLYRRLKPFVLDQVRGPGSPAEWVLERPEIVVGRSVQADISIDSHMLSRRHVVLRRRDGEYQVTDLDSANGLYLNGVRAHSAVLREGDLVQIGDVVFLYHEGT